ncbi:MAG TPA: hypothetical protein PKD70_08265 [Saprospiraceae bacterium]|nr:hypothetical protein [Saprospiraceae bacterium]HMP13860.1 hypothetical protein [Saprospiraceae bacterium]
MEELKSLIEIVSLHKVKQISIVGSKHYQNAAPQQLYEKILSGAIDSEEDIIKTFYGDSDNAPAYAVRLKNKLKERLIDTLFFIDTNQKSFSDYNKAYFNCYKDLNAIKILLGRSARRAAIPMAEKALRKAQEYEITDAVVMLATELRYHYGTIEGDIKKFEFYNNVLNKYMELMQIENQADEYYSRIRMHFAKAKGSKPELLRDSDKYLHHMQDILSKYDSYKLNFLYFLIYATHHELSYEYDKLLEISEKALDYFQKKQHIISSVNIFSFKLRAFVSHLKLGHYTKAWGLGAECLQLAEVRPNNWLLTMEYLVILSFHTQTLQRAYNYYRQVLDYPDYNKQGSNIQERWRIYEAYIAYLIAIGKIAPDDSLSAGSFRVQKFINEVPIYQKDKQGANISIIVIQILLLLQQQKYNAIIDRVEALRSYTHRYLRRDDTFRSNCFIRMLIEMANCSFHKKAVLRKTDRYLAQLKELPLQQARQSAELEIIPYEVLWDFVLSHLDEEWH